MMLFARRGECLEVKNDGVEEGVGVERGVIFFSVDGEEGFVGDGGECAADDDAGGRRQEGDDFQEGSSADGEGHGRSFDVGEGDGGGRRRQVERRGKP